MTLLAYLFAVLKNVIYGSSVFFTGALNENVDVLDILAIRFLISFLVLYVLKALKILKINVGIRDVLKKTERSSYARDLLRAAITKIIYFYEFSCSSFFFR